MKRLSLLIVLCFGWWSMGSLAQTPVPTPVVLPPFQPAPCIVTVSDAESMQDVLTFNFRNVRDALHLPGLPPIACNLPTELATSLDRSPSVGINQPAPRALPVDQDTINQARGYAIVNTSSANLRSGPGVQFTRVGVVRGGDNLIVLGQNANQSWWYVQTGDLRGWVFGELLILRGDLSRLPVIQTSAEVIPPTLYVGFTGNPLYNELSNSGVSLCAVQGRMEHPLLGISFNKKWYVIEATCTDGSKQVGWISANMGLVRNPAGLRLPIIREIERPAPQP